MSDTFAKHRLCVAPMLDRTDRHCRYLLRLIAPRARLYTEMITARALLEGDRERFLRCDAREHPVALQLGGSDPAELAAAARFGAEAGYDEINLNVGCPSNRVKAGCFGAALMLDPPRVADCIAALAAAVPVPVTVKTRLGVDDRDTYDFLRGFAHAVVAAGCRTLIVHARKAWLSGLSPKQNRTVPPLDYARVHRLKHDFPAVEVVVNGGLTDIPAVRRELAHVDGVMLGRSAYHEPMLMAELDRLFGGPFVGRFPNRDDALAGYCRYIETELDAGTPLRAMTRHLLGFYTHERGGRRWRRELSRLRDGAAGLQQLRALIREQADADSNHFAELATITPPVLQLSQAR
jgi:tRNA-dihydrouridine synthase A